MAPETAWYFTSALLSGLQPFPLVCHLPEFQLTALRNHPCADISLVSLAFHARLMEATLAEVPCNEIIASGRLKNCSAILSKQ